MPVKALRVVHCALSEAIAVRIRGEVLAEIDSEWQHLEVLAGVDGNRYLLLDSMVQLSAADEGIYHEALVHAGMLASESPRRILILGGGDGGALREVLRHDPEAVTICDLDPTVGEVSRRFFPEVSAGAFADSRLRVVARDGRAFLAESEETWDGIIVDLTDPSGPCRLLYTREFYDLARQRLAPQGFLVTNADTPDVGGLFAEVVATLRCAFPVVHAYLAFVPSFFVRQGFALAFAEAPPVLPEAGARAARFATTMAARGLETRAFDSVDLARFFELTLAVRTLLSRAVAISTDERPLEIAQAGAEAFERDGP